ncbi:MAG TPA: nitrogenase component 1 [Polyangia bacterium]|jgi:hypothetical protein
MAQADPGAARRGGPRTVAFFSGLLGFDRQAEYRVRTVEHRDGRFAVDVKGPRGDAVSLLVEEAAPERACFHRSDALALSYQGAELPAEVARLLQKWAFVRPKGATPQALREVLENDPDTVALQPAAAAPVAAPPAPTAQEVLGPGFNLGTDFAAEHGILCYRVLSMWSFNPVTVILHGDSECFGPPNLGLDMVMTANAPWDNHVRDIGRPGRVAQRFTEPDPDALLLHVTDVRDADVISGTRDREKAIFKHVFDRNPTVVVFFHACTGVVAGADMEEMYRAYKAKHGWPVLYFRGGENRLLQDFYRELLVDLRGTWGAAAVPAATKVNLVGYTGIANSELTGLVTNLGAEVNGVILPGIDVGSLQRFEGGGVNVVLGNNEWEDFYGQILRGTKVPREIRPHGPYGVRGTARWLETIAGETGLTPNVAAALEPVVAAHRDRWQALTEQARGQTLGFVVRDDAAALLADPARSYGIPLLPTVTEMGFGVEILIQTTSEAATSEAKTLLAAAAGADARVTFRTFDSFASLAERLRASEARAFLSNYYFDWRLTTAGKAPFSLQHFEAGVEGACRTLERLLALCTATFYRTYARYLPADRSAPRTPAKA